MTGSPYEGLPSERYWRTGVVEQHPTRIKDLYHKRFDISADDRIATAGSCFAQHIARNLRQRGCNVLDVEPAPPGMDAETAKSFGFGLYSARYGNIYTVRQLLQLVREALGDEPSSDIVWERNGRYFDALRPSVEPKGHASADLVLAHRQDHLRDVKSMFETADLLIFTLGLTEAWRHKESGTVYPTAPGTIAGRFDPDVFEFVNFTATEVVQDFSKLRRMLHRINPSLKFLLTVSPVPLTATASDQHVLAATTYSKAALRAACGELYQKFDDLDYFPSYEVIASPFARGFFFESNLRSVSDAGVETVMRVFFGEHANLTQTAPAERPAARDPEAGRRRDRQRGRDPSARPGRAQSQEDVVCEEALLDAFAR